MRLAEQQFPLPNAEKFDGEVSWRHLLEFYCETGPQHPQTVSGFQSVRPPTAQWLQPNGTSARPKGIGESIQLRSLKGTPERAMRCLNVPRTAYNRSYVNFAPSAHPSAGAIGASRVVNYGLSIF